MPSSNTLTWVAPVAAVSGLLFSVGCAWWQARRDRREFLARGTLPSREVSWRELLLFLLAVVGPIAAFKTSNGSGLLSTSLALSLAALVSQLWLLRRVGGRVEMAAGVCLGMALNAVVLVHELGKFAR